MHTASFGLLIAKFWSFASNSALCSGGKIRSRILMNFPPKFPAIPWRLLNMLDMLGVLFGKEGAKG
jgi:hypothetical protein